MNRVKSMAGVMMVVVSLAVIAVGCGAGRTGTQHTEARSTAARSPSVHATIMRPGEAAAIPNPGTGKDDPHVAAALLTRFQSAHESRELPGAVVAMPVTDRTSMFIALRQVSSPLHGGRDCEKWTAGLWRAILDDFNVEGVQIGVTALNASSRESALRMTRPANPLMFTEAVITGPAVAVGDPHLPASCEHLPGLGNDSGAIQPLSVPRVGNRSWAYRITGTGKIPIWQWVEVVQTRRYLLEIRIPNQAPAPRTDPARLLPLIAQAAYAKAETALR
jgi:hypothetical protein